MAYSNSSDSRLLSGSTLTGEEFLLFLPIRRNGLVFADLLLRAGCRASYIWKLLLQGSMQKALELCFKKPYPRNSPKETTISHWTADFPARPCIWNVSNVIGLFSMARRGYRLFTSGSRSLLCIGFSFSSAAFFRSGWLCEVSLWIIVGSETSWRFSSLDS